MKKPHQCKENTTCTCSMSALVPSDKCPIHGAGEWPRRCALCGRYIPTPKDSDTLFDSLPEPTDRRMDALYRTNPQKARAIKAKAGLMLTTYDPEGSARELITDMLTDLRHLCDYIHLDFHSCDQSAQGHYQEEAFDAHLLAEHKQRGRHAA